MACETLSNYHPIIMKFSGYLLLHENTSAIDFGPDRSIALVGDAPKGDTTNKIALMCVSGIEISEVLPLRLVQ